MKRMKSSDLEHRRSRWVSRSKETGVVHYRNPPISYRLFVSKYPSGIEWRELYITRYLHELDYFTITDSLSFRRQAEAHTPRHTHTRARAESSSDAPHRPIDPLAHTHAHRREQLYERLRDRETETRNGQDTRETCVNEGHEVTRSVLMGRSRTHTPTAVCLCVCALSSVWIVAPCARCRTALPPQSASDERQQHGRTGTHNGEQRRASKAAQAAAVAAASSTRAYEPEQRRCVRAQ